MRRHIALALTILLVVSTLSGCGGNTAPAQDTGSTTPSTEAPASTDSSGETTDAAGDGGSSSGENETLMADTLKDSNSLYSAMNYSGMDTAAFENEEEAKAFVMDMSLNDTLSESLFFLSEADRKVFSDSGYGDARDALVAEIIAESKALEASTGELLQTIDKLQASLLTVVNTMDQETLPVYFSSMYVVHGSYMADIIEGQLTVESYDKVTDDPYMDSWYQELTVNARMMNSIYAVDYLNQLLVDGVMLSEYAASVEDSAATDALNTIFDAVDAQASVYEAVVNGKRSILAMMEALEEADQYYALATAKAVMESADAAKALLMENFPEGMLTEADKALVNTQVDFYVAASEAFYNEVLATSEYALELPQAAEEVRAPAFATMLFGIAYADENSEAVQLKAKAEEATKKRSNSVFSVVGNVVGAVKNVVVGTVDIATDVVSKGADVVYGTAKGVVSLVKYTAQIDDSKAFKQELKSIKKMITGSPGAAAKELSSVADKLAKSVEEKIGKALDYIPMGDVAKGALKYTVKGYTGLVKAVADAFDGEKPGIQKIFSIIEASGLYKADILTNASEMLKTAGGEKLKSMMPESITKLYDAMTEVAANVEQEVQAYKQQLIDEMLNSEAGQKAQTLVGDVQNTVNEIQEIPEKITQSFKETITAEASGDRNVTENAEKQINDVSASSNGQTGRWSFLPQEMQVVLMGFEEDLRARALKEVAAEIEKMQGQGVYSGYMMKVHHGGGTQEIGMGNSSVTFSFGEKAVAVQFNISGTGTIDSSGTIDFASYTMEGGHVSMQTSNSFVGPLSIEGTISQSTFTGTMNFSLQSAPATITFHTSKKAAQ